VAVSGQLVAENGPIDQSFLVSVFAHLDSAEQLNKLQTGATDARTCALRTVHGRFAGSIEAQEHDVVGIVITDVLPYSDFIGSATVANGAVDFGTIVLVEAGQRVSGVVRTKDGKRIAGAKVVVTAAAVAQDHNYSQVPLLMYSSANGAFASAVIIAPGKYGIQCDIEGYYHKDPDEIVISRDNGNKAYKEIVVQDQSERFSIGTVVDESGGLPLPNVPIALYEGESRTLASVVQSDSDGVFRIEQSLLQEDIGYVTLGPGSNYETVAPVVFTKGETSIRLAGRVRGKATLRIVDESGMGMETSVMRSYSLELGGGRLGVYSVYYVVRETVGVYHVYGRRGLPALVVVMPQEEALICPDPVPIKCNEESVTLVIRRGHELACRLPDVGRIVSVDAVRLRQPFSLSVSKGSLRLWDPVHEQQSNESAEYDGLIARSSVHVVVEAEAMYAKVFVDEGSWALLLHVDTGAQYVVEVAMDIGTVGKPIRM
jgi:hypothetical protein